MTNVLTQKIEEVFKDKDFVEKLSKLEDPADVQAAFAEKGLDFSIEEIKEVGRLVAAGNAGDEVSEAALDTVAGGGLFTACVVLAAALINLGTAIKTKSW